MVPFMLKLCRFLIFFAAISICHPFSMMIPLTFANLKTYIIKSDVPIPYWAHSSYDEESDHSNKAVRKTPEIESGHKVSEEVK